MKEEISSKKRIALVGTLWGLFFQGVIFFYWFGDSLYFIVFAVFGGIPFVAVTLLAPYWRKKYGVLMIPSPLYRIYFIEAAKRTWARFLLLFSVFALIVVCSGIPDILTAKPASVGEMRMVRGKIIKYNKASARGGVGAYLIILTEKSKKIRLRYANLRDQRAYIKKAKKQNDYIVIWFFERFKFTRDKYLEIGQIEYDGKVILTYSSEGYEKARRFSARILLFLIIYILFVHLIIVLKLKSH